MKTPLDAGPPDLIGPPEPSTASTDAGDSQGRDGFPRVARPEFDSRREHVHRQESRSTARVIATFDLHVPRDQPSDLKDGIQAVVERADWVHRAEVRAVRRVSPTAFDLDVTARVAMTIDDSHEFDGLRAALLDRFGIVSVQELQIDEGPFIGR